MTEGSSDFSVSLCVKYPESDYPTVPPLISIESSHPIGSEASRNLLRALDEKVSTIFLWEISHKFQLEDLADTPVVFELVQVVQQEMVYLTAELGRGYFAELPSDILCRILESMDFPNLCTL